MYLDCEYTDVLNRYLFIAHIRYYIYLRKEILRTLSNYIPNHIIRFSLLGYICPSMTEFVGAPSFQLSISNCIRLHPGFVLKTIIKENYQFICLMYQNKILFKNVCEHGNQKHTCDMILEKCLVHRFTQEEINVILGNQKNKLV